MAAFLDCLQQFQEEIEKDNSDFHLPYKYGLIFLQKDSISKLSSFNNNRIQNGKIVDQTKHLYSIK